MRVYQFRHTGMRRHLYPKAGALGKKKITGPEALLSSARQKPQKAALIAWTALCSR